MKANSYVLDTSVIVEYLDEESLYREKIESLYKYIKDRRVTGYVSQATLAECLCSYASV